MSFKVEFTEKPAFVGEEFVATGSWTVNCTETYNRSRQTRLLLHPYKGWRFLGDLLFLKDLWRIESLRIFNNQETDLTPLYEHSELEKLGMLGVKITKKNPGFDFSKFRNLRFVDLRWMNGFINFNRASGLEYIQIWGLTGVRRWDLSCFPRLEVLEVHGARTVECIDFTGLHKLRSITLLAMPKLNCLSAIENVQVSGESWLRIDGSKKLSASTLRQFKIAKHVSLEGKQIVRDGINVRPWPDDDVNSQ